MVHAPPANKNSCKFEEFPINQILDEPGMAKLIKYITPITELTKKYTYTQAGNSRVNTFISALSPFLESINSQLILLNTPQIIRLYQHNGAFTYKTIDRPPIIPLLESNTTTTPKNTTNIIPDIYEKITVALFFTLVIAFMAWTMEGITVKEVEKTPLPEEMRPSISIYTTFDLYWNSTITSVAKMNTPPIDLSNCSKINILRTNVINKVSQLAGNINNNGKNKIINKLTTRFKSGNTLQHMLTLLFNYACIRQGFNIDGVVRGGGGKKHKTHRRTKLIKKSHRRSNRRSNRRKKSHRKINLIKKRIR